ncbi:alpha/beta hydrolase family esterase [Rhizobium sp. YIM 134829]|uniref:extracellular catalytic domain type 1 short-chain-length polyhydroxyalkanoate depolymerase n=1 Tax=Rhizobium sp. YIM 134829 TaxID=3390453 RepID=UPI00397E1F47
MPSLADTIHRLSQFRLDPLLDDNEETRLTPFSFSGANPGQLKAWSYVPDVVRRPPLVVVLHGCKQTAARYDRGSGWSRLADEAGFALLFPEQQRQNNPSRCFNWFMEADATRGAGEVASIRSMIDEMIRTQDIDSRRIYVTGLSAGGAMASALLAAYPELFASGAVIAGLPSGVASTIPQAFDRMRGHGLPSAPDLQAHLSAASPHPGPWPTVSVWQGTADKTVAESNAMAIVDQWRGVHGLGPRPDRLEEGPLRTRMVWKDRTGREAITLHLIQGMEHGTPLDPASGFGEAGPYMLDVGISSTLEIARSFELIKGPPRRQAAREGSKHAPQAGAQVISRVQRTIESALRSAGLLR